MNMATAGYTAELQRELICAICLEYFDDPVILKCGHNFCRVCILTHWEENGGVDVGYECPECRMVFNKISFTKNYLAKNLVDKLNDLEPPKTAVKLDGRCDRHREELKLYCYTDHKPICVVCRESKAHKHHDVAPVSEVLKDMKTELRQRLIELHVHKSVCSSVKAAEEQAKSDAQDRKQMLKESIEKDVGVLVQFLLDERDSLLDSLEVKLAAATAAIDDNLAKVETEAAAMDKAIAEIQNHISGKTSIESITQTMNNPVLINHSFTVSASLTEELLEMSSPFQLFMWKKMMHVLHTMPQNLTLDPDTAHPNLVITDFDTKVEEGRIRCQEPDFPQRFTRFCGILATARYTSGQHYWEVDVRDKGVWYLGVTSEYSCRKGFVNLSPTSGYWSLTLQDRLYANEEEGKVPVADYWDSPRVGVYLDFDRRCVSFYDAVTMKRLYVFRSYFDEPVYPFFSPGKNDPGSRLQICHYY